MVNDAIGLAAYCVMGCLFQRGLEAGACHWLPLSPHDDRDSRRYLCVTW
ncbi:MAG: hypothetical protein R3D29_03905 [Nitratireductor sp.]